MTPEKALEILRERGVKEPSITADREMQPPRFDVRSAGVLLAHGHSIRDAMRRGGFTRPPGFTGQGTSVMCGEEQIATARSSTMARRIANALNLYSPGERGF